MTAVFVSNPADRLETYYGPRALAELRELATVRLNPHDRELAIPELARAAADCEVLVAYRGTAGTAELFGALPRLRAFVRCATDIRNIDLAAAAEHGVLVTRTGPGFAAAVAEWVIGVLVDLGRGITAHAASYRAGVVPRPMMGRELRGSVLGVIGHGLIGREVARLAQAFGMQVLATDPHQALTGGPRQVELPVLLAQSDAVVLLAAATEETENLMDARAFAAMKPGAFFINASRGSLVDEPALRAAH
jgi:D-3-phosphoglycerate dehydrogenase / 2-oxoglutarate reductase